MTKLIESLLVNILAVLVFIVSAALSTHEGFFRWVGFGFLLLSGAWGFLAAGYWYYKYQKRDENEPE
jgi:positive regulator of sigma E activity